MSILAGRLAATEGAYFLQESKHAAGRLAQKLPPPKSGPIPHQPPPEAAPGPDVLPEILRHSIPIKGTVPYTDTDPSISAASRWLLPATTASAPRVSPDVLNPLNAYVKLPPATFGPRRWQLPNEQPTVLASTANELRLDRYSAADSEKLKDLAVGYLQIGKAFAVATTIVFGGATVLFAYTAHKLQMASTDDIRTKGRDLIKPGADRIQEQLVSVRAWAENVSRKWHFEGVAKNEEKSIIKELSKTLGARTSN